MNLYDGWEVHKKGKKVTMRPLITLSDNFISFNSAFIRNNRFTDKSFVNIYVKKTDIQLSLAIEFASEEGDNSFKLSKPAKDTRGDGRFISASGLYNSYGIVPSKLKIKHFNPREDTITGKRVFIIDISLEELK